MASLLNLLKEPKHLLQTRELDVDVRQKVNASLMSRFTVKHRMWFRKHAVTNYALGHVETDAALDSSGA